MIMGQTIRVLGIVGIALLLSQGCSQKNMRYAGGTDAPDSQGQYAEGQQSAEENPFTAGDWWEGNGETPSQSQSDSNLSAFDKFLDYFGWLDRKDESTQLAQGSDSQDAANSQPSGESGNAPAQTSQDAGQGPMAEAQPNDKNSSSNASSNSESAEGLDLFATLQELDRSGSNGSQGWNPNGMNNEEFVEEGFSIAEAPSGPWGEGQVGNGQMGQDYQGNAPQFNAPFQDPFANASTRVQLQDVFFEYDSWRITRTGTQALGFDANWLVENDHRSLTVEGHCDQRGTQDYNIVLGEKRAKAVRTYLVDLGVKSNQVNIISYGKERPFCMGTTEECFQLNRRGHLMLHQ